MSKHLKLPVNAQKSSNVSVLQQSCKEEVPMLLHSDVKVSLPVHQDLNAVLDTKGGATSY